ncbi:PucR family transcriptional regulator [Microbacterium sp. PI-1]|uniref:PucR family transcriptional regulator ligand-binding domain-containing protein n=1 Tax=Microbacterium sp. PI-1 TaxID=2545631 RepID=UPI00103FA5E3|nr:PucR family transcriptional regulator ligand-binding domain-containing protein [Microbacterium sp. PI-1]TCJ21551.1 PucR family transcriptional regulator [Microbacterium sp. PI-1]
MSATLRELVGAGFGIDLLVSPEEDVELSWAHASDLEDPTPFTEAGQLLLTTGRQFAEDWGPAQYEAFVARLARARVAAVGFGTEVFRAGTPAELVTACEGVGLPLVEVSYGTPFIAIGRWVADRQQAAARARLEWALSAQAAISSAAIGAGGLADAVERAARLLRAKVSILDRDLVPIVRPRGGTGTLPQPVAQQARRVLRGRRRASLQLEDDGTVLVMHTLGRGERLRGVLVAERDTIFDEAERSALTTLIALAEVSLVHMEDVRESVQALLAELFVLLRDGRMDIVRSAIAGLPAGLPERRFHVVAFDAGDTDDALQSSLAQQAADPAHRTFHVQHGDRILFLVDVRRWAAVRSQIEAGRTRAGFSEEVGWAALDAGVLQAVRSLEAAPPGTVRTFRDVLRTSVSGLLAASSVREVAQARLAPVVERTDGRRLLADAAIWLARNAQWDPAAREIGVHRHTLKARMQELGGLLDMDLQRFPARAELWTMLDALGVVAGVQTSRDRDGVETSDRNVR